MNLVSLLGGIALIGAVVFGMQGVDKLTGGELYLASISHLAQETTNSLPPAEPAIIVQPQPTTSTEQRIMLPVENQVQNIIGQPVEQRVMEGQPMQQGTQVIRDETEMRKPIEGERNMIMEEQEQQMFVDPREIQQVTREVKQLNNEIKKVRTQLKRLKAATSDAEELNAIAAEVAKIQAVVINKSASNEELWEAIDEFRNGLYWDRMNKIRAKAEIPNQVSQISQSFKRLEKAVNTKAMQNLGFDMSKVKTTVGEIKQNLAAVQAALAAGNLEEAMETMQYFYDGWHPGEVESTLFRMRDIRNMLKQVRDKDIQAQVEEILQEVIVSFNEGNYRDARETLDEYQDDIMSLLSKLARTKVFKGTAKTESLAKIRNLESLIDSKLQERETVREQKMMK